jgi:hypothetical protein
VYFQQSYVELFAPATGGLDGVAPGVAARKSDTRD